MPKETALLRKGTDNSLEISVPSAVTGINIAALDTGFLVNVITKFSICRFEAVTLFIIQEINYESIIRCLDGIDSCVERMCP